MKKKNYSSSGRHLAECDLEAQPVFSCLSEEEMEILDRHKTCLFFKKGQPVFNEGNYPLGIFSIDSGKIKIEHSGEEGKMQIVRLANAGDLIGYRALFCGEKYNGSAVALEEAHLCFIPKQAFFEVLKTNNKLNLALIRLLASDLRKAEEHLTELAQKPVRERLAKALLFLKDTYGLEEDGATINVSLSREELADLVGTATETAIRLLSELKNDGIIELTGKKIAIADLERLVKTAHFYQPELKVLSR